MPLLKEKKVLESFDCVKNIFIFYKLVLNALNKINKLVKFHYQIQILKKSYFIIEVSFRIITPVDLFLNVFEIRLMKKRKQLHEPSVFYKKMQFWKLGPKIYIGFDNKFLKIFSFDDFRSRI